MYVYNVFYQLSAMINNEADVALQGLKQNDDTVLAGDADIELRKMQRSSV